MSAPAETADRLQGSFLRADVSPLTHGFAGHPVSSAVRAPGSAASRPTGGPELLPPHHPRPHPSLLALWHLLSLDAPTVAAVWTLFIAHCTGLVLPWTAPLAMFVAVWIIYAADRLLDARILDLQHDPDLQARHHFHHRHRARFLSAITAASIFLVYLLHRIDPAALHLYALLAVLFSVWMLLIHARPLPDDVTQRLPKELAVGIFFPAAVFIPTVARAPVLRPELLPAAALFALVCTLNCLFLYAWEHPSSRPQAHWTTRWATAHLTHLAASLLALAIATASLPRPTLAIILPALACALSTACLLLLNALRHRLSPLHLRAAADLALLSPLFLLPFAR
jgi:hypothetical protein